MLAQGYKSKNIFSEQKLRKHIQYLGSDIFEGRGTGSIGGELASKYLALQLNEFGIKPFGNNNSYYQHVPMHGISVLENSELILLNDNKIKALTLKEDYFVFQTGIQTFIPNPVEMIFAGYGITAPEFDYNDYEEIDVRGKIVVCLEGEPLSTDEDYFKASVNTIYSFPESKLRIAVAQGAIGCIIIPLGYYENIFNWDDITNEFNFETISLAYSPNTILGVLIKPSVSEYLFSGTNYNLKKIYEMHSSNHLTCFSLNCKLTFKGKFLFRDFVSPNVIGIIEGSDPELKNEYVVISAHYDHLGIGPAIKGDSIYNGVLDNAIGVAGVLELANKLNKDANEIRRSIIILFTTGEEKGLLGSNYYVDHSVVPLYKTTANINVDGLAWIDNFKSIIGLGANYSDLDLFLYDVAKSSNLNIVDIPEQFIQEESFYYSDQISFAKEGIPSILVVEGPDLISFSYEEAINLIKDYFINRYHSPFDDLSQKINFNSTVQHLEFIYDLILEIANSDEGPQWKSGSPFINARLRSIAEKR